MCPIQNAKAYPFLIPEDSYVIEPDGWFPLTCAPQLAGRHAVIASGSNASPERLRAKFGEHRHLLEAGIPVLRAQLHDFDAVYSAHIANYGSIPATLAHAPGTVLDVFVTWLTDAQLERMHETEAVGVNYDFVRLSGIHLLCDSGAALTTAHAYLSKRGCLNMGGKPVALTAINAIGRPWQSMTQIQVLDYARNVSAPHEDLDAFIRQHIDCPDTRTSRTQSLSQSALGHGYRSVTVESV
ncbi:MAG TPA: hypothetical protein VIN57_05600 [Magnetovibrio sp.]